MGPAPRTKVLVAVGGDNRDRLHIARATGERVGPLAEERRAARQ